MSLDVFLWVNIETFRIDRRKQYSIARSECNLFQPVTNQYMNSDAETKFICIALKKIHWLFLLGNSGILFVYFTNQFNYTSKNIHLYREFFCDFINRFFKKFTISLRQIIFPSFLF